MFKDNTKNRLPVYLLVSFSSLIMVLSLLYVSNSNIDLSKGETYISNKYLVASVGSGGSGFSIEAGDKIVIVGGFCGLAGLPTNVLKETIFKVTGINSECGPLINAAQTVNGIALSSFDHRIFVGWGQKNGSPLYEQILPANSDLDSYAIVLDDDNDLLIFSRTAQDNSGWAVLDFMERYADYYLYGPKQMGDLFETYKHKDSIVVPPGLSIIEKPSYKSRYYSGASGTSNYGGSDLPSFKLAQHIQQQHAFTDIIPPNTYGNSSSSLYRPEFFPLIATPGAPATSISPAGYIRHIPSGGAQFDFQPSIANQAFQDFIVDYVIKYFTDDPKRLAVSLSQNDSGKFCDWSVEQLAPLEFNGVTLTRSQRIAYSWARFYNEIARRVKLQAPQFSGKIISMMAYGATKTLPPGMIKFDPMIMTFVTVDAAQFFDPVVVEDFNNEIRNWNEFVDKTAVHDYPFGMGFIIPRIYNRHQLPILARQYDMGTVVYYGEAYPNWGLDGPKLWLMSKILWSTKVDYVALENKYYQDMYGPVSGKMKDFFNLMEEAWTNQDPNWSTNHTSNYRFLIGTGLEGFQTKIINKDYSKRGRGLLDDALNTINNLIGQTGDAELLRQYRSVKNRIEYTSKSFKYPEALSVTRGLSDEIESNTENILESGAYYNSLNEVLSYDIPSIVQELRTLPSPAIFNLPEIVGLHMYEDRFVNNYKGLIVKTYELLQNLGSYLIANNPSKTFVDMKTAMISKVNSINAINGSTNTRALNFLKENAIRSIVFVSTSTTERGAPLIDGSIESDKWDKPFFDGNFFNSYSLYPSKFRTKIYALTVPQELNKTYFAVDMESDKSVMGSSDWGSTTGVPLLQGILRSDDALFISWKYKGSPVIYGVTFNTNEVTTGYSTPPEGSISFKTKQTINGWQAEIVINKKATDIESVNFGRSTRINTPYTFKDVPHPVESSLFVPMTPVGNTCASNIFVCGYSRNQAQIFVGQTVTGIFAGGEDPTPTPTPNPGGGNPTPTPTPNPGGGNPTPTPTPNPGGGNPTPTPTPNPGGSNPTPTPTPNPGGGNPTPYVPYIPTGFTKPNPADYPNLTVPSGPIDIDLPDAPSWADIFMEFFEDIYDTVKLGAEKTLFEVKSLIK